MKYQLTSHENIVCHESPMFIEGVVLAANMATKPLQPEAWLEQVFGEQADALKSVIVGQINHQFSYLKCNEYSLNSLIAESDNQDALSDFARGFMTLWPTIEEQWLEASVNDGTMRMLQAMLTTFMLAIDEKETQAQMLAAGIDTPPSLTDFMDQLDLMIGEVAQAADELMVGAKAQSVNPFKDIGRNETCSCGSGKKFKQCCGK